MPDVSFIRELRPALMDEINDQGIMIRAEYGIRFNEKTGSYIFSGKVEIQNKTAEKISLVRYQRYFYDENDEQLTDGWDEYYGYDSYIAQDQKVQIDDSFQIKLDKRPVRLRLAVGKVASIDEEPLIHLPLPGEYLYQALNDERINALKIPNRISVGLAGGLTITFKECADPETIRQFMEAFSKVRIVKEGGMMMTDNDNVITFYYDDDQQSGVRFNGVNLELYIRHKHFMYYLSDYEELFLLMSRIVGINRMRGVF